MSMHGSLVCFPVYLLSAYILSQQFSTPFGQNKKGAVLRNAPPATPIELNIPIFDSVVQWHVRESSSVPQRMRMCVYWIV